MKHVESGGYDILPRKETKEQPERLEAEIDGERKREEV